MSSHVTAPATLVPGVSTHRLLALVGVLAVMTGTTAGVAVAGLLALVVLVREAARWPGRRPAASRRTSGVGGGRDFADARTHV